MDNPPMIGPKRRKKASITRGWGASMAAIALIRKDIDLALYLVTKCGLHLRITNLDLYLKTANLDLHLEGLRITPLTEPLT